MDTAKNQQDHLQSALRPVTHDAKFPFSVPPLDGIYSIQDEMVIEECISNGRQNSSADPDIPNYGGNKLQTFSQEKLNDLVRKMTLSKDKAKLLSYYKRNPILVTFFKTDDLLSYCSVIG